LLKVAFIAIIEIGLTTLISMVKLWD